MVKAGQLISQGLWAAWDGFWMVWLSNILFLLLCLPLITIPLAFAGLYTCAHALANGDPVDWKSFFSGIKHHFGTSIRWTAINMLVIFPLGFYVWYFSVPGSNVFRAGGMLTYISLGLIAFWLIINMYTFPFMLAQEKASYRQALRNSLVMFLKWPGVTLGITLFNIVIFGLSTVIRVPWIILGASLPALLACLCVEYAAAQTLHPGSDVLI